VIAAVNNPFLQQSTLSEEEIKAKETSLQQLGTQMEVFEALMFADREEEMELHHGEVGLLI
jgi:hypothetical protein